MKNMTAILVGVTSYEVSNEVLKIARGLVTHANELSVLASRKAIIYKHAVDKIGGGLPVAVRGSIVRAIACEGLEGDKRLQLLNSLRVLHCRAYGEKKAPSKPETKKTAPKGQKAKALAVIGEAVKHAESMGITAKEILAVINAALK